MACYILYGGEAAQHCWDKSKINRYKCVICGKKRRVRKKSRRRFY